MFNINELIREVKIVPETKYVTSMLETYRDGIEVGPNSSLMIMMAMPLTDVEIANLAAYLKDAVYKQP